MISAAGVCHKITRNSKIHRNYCCMCAMNRRFIFYSLALKTRIYMYINKRAILVKMRYFRAFELFGDFLLLLNFVHLVHLKRISWFQFMGYEFSIAFSYGFFTYKYSVCSMSLEECCFKSVLVYLLSNSPVAFQTYWLKHSLRTKKQKITWFSAQNFSMSQVL